MNRRLFAGSLLATSLALTVGRVAARQSATPPVASPEADRIPISSQPGFVRGVSRAYRLPDPSFSDVMRGGLLGLQVSGMEFDAANNASAAMAFLTSEVPAYFARTTPDVVDHEVAEESFDALGEDMVAMTVTYAFPETDVISELLFGVVLVRKGELLLAVVGYGIEDAAIQAYDVAVSLDDRWPGDDLWAMVPEQGEVPDGMVLVEEKELRPGE